MKIHTLALLMALSLFLSQTCNVWAADAERVQAAKGPMPNKLWQVGDTWNLLIEIFPGPSWYDSGEAAKKWAEVGYLPPLYHFVMQVKIAGIENVRDVACWQVDFTPQEDGTNNSKPAKMRASIGQQDGLFYKLVRFPQPEDIGQLWITLGQFNVFPFPMERFPTIFMPAATEENLEVHPDNSAWCLNIQSQWQDKGHKEFLQEQRIRRVGPHGETIWKMDTVRQHWTVGAKWWHEYEQYNGNRMLLRATLLPNASVPQAARTIPASKAQTKSGDPSAPMPPVSKSVPFTPEANYMSMPGYLRWQYYLASGRWSSREMAVEGVAVKFNRSSAPAK